MTEILKVNGTAYLKLKLMNPMIISYQSFIYEKEGIMFTLKSSTASNRKSLFIPYVSIDYIRFIEERT